MGSREVAAFLKEKLPPPPPHPTPRHGVELGSDDVAFQCSPLRVLVWDLAIFPNPSIELILKKRIIIKKGNKEQH